MVTPGGQASDVPLPTVATRAEDRGGHHRRRSARARPQGGAVLGVAGGWGSGQEVGGSDII